MRPSAVWSSGCSCRSGGLGSGACSASPRGSSASVAASRICPPGTRPSRDPPEELAIAGNNHPKVMLLAIDASPADRIEEWIASASLPNLAGLRARGTHGRIESTADYLVGTPWPTFNTGSLPPEHGWNYYLTWRPDLMRFVRPTQEWLPVDPFYRNFPLDGPRVIAIDVPHTYAARPFNGVELTGWGAEARVGPPDDLSRRACRAIATRDRSDADRRRARRSPNRARIAGIARRAGRRG